MADAYDPTKGAPELSLLFSTLQALGAAVFVLVVGMVMSQLLAWWFAMIPAAALAVGFTWMGFSTLRTYLHQRTVWKNYHPAWHPDEDVYDAFAVGLEEWSKTGTEPPAADQDTAFYLELQEKRLARFGLQMNYTLTPYTINSDNGFTRERGAALSSLIRSRTINRTITISNAEGELFHKKNDQDLVAVITSEQTPQLLGKRPCICPNCGNITLVENLVAGCPYCGTRYVMSDLFPKVTNFWFRRHDAQETTRSIGIKIFSACMGGSALLCFAISLIGNVPTPVLLLLLESLFTGAIVGGFLGLIVFDIIVLVRAFSTNSGRFAPLSAASTPRKIQRFMAAYDPDFSMEYFESQVLSALRAAILTDDVANLSAYVPAERDPEFDRIIDVMYENALKLIAIRVENGMVAITLDAYLLDTLFEDDRVFQRPQTVRFTVARAANARTNTVFSMRFVRCPACGASYDAAHQTHCPYCDTPYHMVRDAWTIMSMHLTQR